MSTNFYAHLKVGTKPVYTEVIFHIGKSVYQGLSTMNGSVFPTVDAWEQFLLHNETFVQVVDEYGRERKTADFIKEQFRIPQASDNQRNWLLDHGYTIHDQPVPRDYTQTAHWMDGDQLFYNGEFN